MNDRRPVAEISYSGKQEVTRSGEKITHHREDQEITGCGPAAPRSPQQQIKNCCEEQVYQRAIGRDPSSVDVSLQGDRADGQAVSSAEPRSHTVSQTLVQNILELTGH